MSLDRILDATASYLKDYVAPFLDEGEADDIRTVQTGEFDAYDRPLLDLVDYHLGRFRALDAGLPTTDRDRIKQAAATIEDPVIIDAGSFAGEYFGAWMAQRLPKAQVYVFNPLIDRDVKSIERMVGEKNPENFFSGLQTKKTEDAATMVADLYAQKGLENISYVKECLTSESLERLREEHKGRRIVVYADRTPTVPFDLALSLAEQAKADMGIDVVFFPYINTPLEQKADPLQVLDRSLELFDAAGKETVRSGNRWMEPAESAATRLFSAANLHYAARVAKACDAKVYRNGRRNEGFAYAHPQFVVSTLDGI